MKCIDWILAAMERPPVGGGPKDKREERADRALDRNVLDGLRDKACAVDKEERQLVSTILLINKGRLLSVKRTAYEGDDLPGWLGDGAYS